MKDAMNDPSTAWLEEPPTLTPAEIATKLLKLMDLETKVKEEINVRREALLQSMKEMGVTQLKTTSFVLSLAKRVSVKVDDFEAAKKDLTALKIPYTEKAVFGDEMTKVFKTLAEKGQEVEGISSSETEYIRLAPVKGV